VPERPERMRRRGRLEDQEFSATERLFRRYTRSHYINGQFSNTGFNFDRQSVNREKYSEPGDVLFDEADLYEGCGVLSFRTQDLPISFPPEHPQLSFSPKHVPMEDNYAHSEVWCDKIPATGEYVTPSKSLRKLFRTILSQRVVIEIVATI